MVVGHPFKGGMPMSTGQLEHPDMKRFEINDSTAFVPPRPDVANGATFTAAPAPTYFDFFSTYFAGRSLNSSDPFLLAFWGQPAHEAQCDFGHNSYCVWCQQTSPLVGALAWAGGLLHAHWGHQLGLFEVRRVQ